jgi:hypothetical protein
MTSTSAGNHLTFCLAKLSAQSALLDGLLRIKLQRNLYQKILGAYMVRSSWKQFQAANAFKVHFDLLAVCLTCSVLTFAMVR